MASYKIVLGNKNYSSWSLRPWLALKHVGAAFEEVVVPLDQPNTRDEILRFSPSGRVPALVHGEVTVWDSLAICEYLNEQFPDKGLWPKDLKARAVGRSVSAEMHSGFQALRTDLPMKFKETIPTATFRPEVKQDIDRITGIWNACRKQFGAQGAFLLGAFSIADAMYGPVVSRFKTYGVTVDRVSQAYMEAMWKLPAMQEWLTAARAESFTMARYEKK